MKKFDLKKFEKYQIQNKAKFILEDSTIQILEKRSFYSEQLIKKNSVVSLKRIYNISNLQLIDEFETFLSGSSPIGKYKKFDSNGKLEVEKDISKNFKIDINELIAIIKEKYNRDITEQESRLRVGDNPKPVYSLFWMFEGSTQKGISILVDGITGEIIKESKIISADY